MHDFMNLATWWCELLFRKSLWTSGKKQSALVEKGGNMKWLLAIFILSSASAFAYPEMEGRPFYNQNYLNCEVRNNSRYWVQAVEVYYQLECVRGRSTYFETHRIPCNNGICDIAPRRSLMFMGPWVGSCRNNVARTAYCGIYYR